MISAKIIADSVSPQGHRITTFELVFPRMILAELNTHRLFSRNSASSRAIPFSKMVKAVQDNPFIPIAWQKDHKGMQGSEYFTNEREIKHFEFHWLKARDNAIQSALSMHNNDLYPDRVLTKQLCNRLLEPFMWHKVLLTATEFDNFFELRCPQYSLKSPHGEHLFRSKKDALAFFLGTGYNDECENFTDLEWLQINKGQSEVHMMALAEAMWDAYNESVPKQLKAGEWHIPYNNIDLSHSSFDKFKHDDRALSDEELVMLELKISTAKCARVSYTTVGEDGKEIPYEKDIALHDSLLSSGHMSPFEHCARVMSDREYSTFIKGRATNEDLPIFEDIKDGYVTIEELKDDNKFGWCNNFRGWIQYRYLLENQ